MRLLDNKNRSLTVAAQYRRAHDPLFRAARVSKRLLVLLAFAGTLFAQGVPVLRPGDIYLPPPGGQVPKQLADVGIDQRLGAKVPTDIPFRNEEGRTVTLGDYLGRRPAVLALVYYECPMLCNMVLNGVVRAARAIPLEAGRDYDIIAVSFNPEETPKIAAAKRDAYVEHYRRPYGREGWHFLTGSESSIRQLTDAAGFHFKRDPVTGQFAHASGVMVLTPDGTLARYFYGVEYSARDLKFSLIEAAKNKIGSPVDKLLLFCFHYDPTQGKYGLIVLNVVKLGGALTAIGLAALVIVLGLRHRRRKWATI